MSAPKIRSRRCECCRQWMTLHRVRSGWSTCGRCRFCRPAVADPRPMPVPIDIDTLFAGAASLVVAG